MKKQISLLITVLIAIGATLTSQLVTAQNDPAASLPTEVVVKGLNQCLALTLKIEGVDETQASVDKQRHVLKVTEATTLEGKALADAPGWTLHYIYNDAMIKLCNDKAFRNADVTIAGTLYPAERALVVKTVEATPADSAEEDLGAKSSFGSASSGADFNWSQEFGSASNKAE